MDKEDRESDLEKEIIDTLTEGELDSEEKDKAIRRKLPHKYEIRIQTQLDPIVEETDIYRGMAKEVDNRYDVYLAKRKPNSKKE